MRFKLYSGDLMGLPTNDKHFNFRWLEPGCKVLFSVCRQGNAASCHFASDKPGMKKIVQAINEFCEFVFWMFDWCEMILAKTGIKKVKAIIKKCRFKKVFKINNVSAYVRVK